MNYGFRRLVRWVFLEEAAGLSECGCGVRPKIQIGKSRFGKGGFHISVSCQRCKLVVGAGVNMSQRHDKSVAHVFDVARQFGLSWELLPAVVAFRERRALENETGNSNRMGRANGVSGFGVKRL